MNITCVLWVWYIKGEDSIIDVWIDMKSKSSTSSTPKWHMFFWLILFLAVAGTSLMFLTMHPVVSQDTASKVNSKIDPPIQNIVPQNEAPQDTKSVTRTDANDQNSERMNEERKDDKDSKNINNKPKKNENKKKPPKKKAEKPLVPADGSLVDADTLEKFHQIHFVHMPKCGGTSMTAVLRQILCAMDPNKNSDCCLNPGFCDWHAFRRCANIKGCINHFPNK